MHVSPLFSSGCEAIFGSEVFGKVADGCFEEEMVKLWWERLR
jgi:hypothetical protein